MWWKGSCIYHIYPRSFHDSNGDGEGDLKGVISKLDYISSLGADAIWLSPFYRSPLNDGGYDVSDPRDVDPRFGSLEDAKQLVEEAHNRGLKVIFDLIPNHFSTDHPWFQAALKAGPNSPERERFHFFPGKGENGEEPPNNWVSLFGGPSWTQVEDGQWYLHIFDSTQADLNWNHPDIFNDFEKTLKFWLDIGVDGYRIDVAHGLIKENINVNTQRDPQALVNALRLDVEMPMKERSMLIRDVPFFDRDGVHDIYKKFRAILNQYEDRMAVAECWVPKERLALYVRPDELHQVFNFDFLMCEWDGKLLKECISRSVRDFLEVGAPPCWAISNHDSPRLVSRVGSIDKARALGVLVHALPGVCYVFNGEELGLDDFTDMPDAARQDPVFMRTEGRQKGRDGARVPLPWDSLDAKSYGFSTGETSTKPWLPQPSRWSAEGKCVNDQENADDSHLSLYKRSLKLRKTLFEDDNLQGKFSFELREAVSIFIERACEANPLVEEVVHFSRLDSSFLLYSNPTSSDLVLKVPARRQAIDKTAPYALLLTSKQGAALESSLTSGEQTLKLPAHCTVWLQSP